MTVRVLSKQRVGGGGSTVQVAAVAAAVLVLVSVLALGTPPMQRAATEPPRATPAVASSYEVATRELIRINHALEARQAELAGAAGASRHSLVRLRAEVASLERQYAAAIEAVSRAR